MQNMYIYIFFYLHFQPHTVRLWCEFCRATTFDCCTEPIEFRLHSKRRRQTDRQTTITPKEICKHDNSFKHKSTHWRNFANKIGKRAGGQNRPCVLGTHMPLFSVPHNSGLSFFCPYTTQLTFLKFFSISFLFNNQPDALIIQIYSVIKLYTFRASSLPIIRSVPLYIRHW
jgi:hypothetical protein